MSDSSRSDRACPAYVLVTGDFVKTGGMDRANYALADFLARQGRELHLVAFRVAEELVQRPGLMFHRVPKLLNAYLISLPLLDFAGRRVARRIARQNGRVVVNGGNCRFGDANWVHHVHATDPLQPGTGISPIKDRFAKWLWRREEKARIPLSRTIITTCARTKRDIVSALGVPGDRVHVVHLGIDPDRFKPLEDAERASLRRQWSWPDVPHVAFVGAMSDRRKGFDVLYSAWRKLCQDPAWTCRLIVVGRGRDRAHWIRCAQDDGLDHRIQFLEFVPDLAEMLGCCDAHALPSRYEGYSMVTQEALACGVPALVSKNAGIAEQYPPGLQELLIDDPTDADELEKRLRYWADNRETLRREAASFSTVLRQHTWDDMAAQMIRIIENNGSC